MTRIHKREFAASEGADMREVFQKTIFELMRDMEKPRDPLQYCPSDILMKGKIFTIEGSAVPTEHGGIRGEIKISIIEKDAEP